MNSQLSPNLPRDGCHSGSISELKKKKQCIVRRAYHWPDLVIGVTPHKDDEKKILFFLGP
jgi:hypothetical protein